MQAGRQAARPSLFYLLGPARSHVVLLLWQGFSVVFVPPLSSCLPVYTVPCTAVPPRRTKVAERSRKLSHYCSVAKNNHVTSAAASYGKVVDQYQLTQRLFGQVRKFMASRTLEIQACDKKKKKKKTALQASEWSCSTFPPKHSPQGHIFQYTLTSKVAIFQLTPSDKHCLEARQGSLYTSPNTVCCTLKKNQTIFWELHAVAYFC